MGYISFEKLDVWKRACRLAIGIYESLRNCRDYGLKDQMTRSAVSIASNTCPVKQLEALRCTTHMFSKVNQMVNFTLDIQKISSYDLSSIAKGSAAELRTQVYIAQQIGVYQNTKATALVTELKEISSMLQGLIKSLAQKT